jgi:hypothetical protein
MRVSENWAPIEKLLVPLRAWHTNGEALLAITAALLPILKSHSWPSWPLLDSRLRPGKQRISTLRYHHMENRRSYFSALLEDLLCYLYPWH